MVQSSMPRMRLGTRGSPLALAQVGEVVRALMAVHGWDETAIEVRIIRTTGDTINDRPLAEAGGKGLFTKELEAALLTGAIDLAVHSAKDMTTELPPGLVLTACLPREDVRDVFVSREATSLETLAPQSVVGTSSLRRQAMIKRARPDVAVVALRGNVETRLKKLAAGAIDATVLAIAGLNRLGLAQPVRGLLSIDDFLPAVGQGAIALEARDADRRVRDLVAAIDHADTSVALAAERAFLAELDGSCRTPIAGHAQLVEGALQFRGMILKPDGRDAYETTRAGAAADAVQLGADAGRELKARAPPDFLATHARVTT